MATESEHAGTIQTCANCGDEFMSSATEDEAMDEYIENFPDDHEAGEPMVVVCDDCYTRLLDAHFKETRPKDKSEASVQASFTVTSPWLAGYTAPPTDAKADPRPTFRSKRRKRGQGDT